MREIKWFETEKPLGEYMVINDENKEKTKKQIKILFKDYKKLPQLHDALTAATPANEQDKITIALLIEALQELIDESN